MLVEQPRGKRHLNLEGKVFGRLVAKFYVDGFSKFF